MPVRPKEWIQREWNHAQVAVLSRKDDFDQVSGLMPGLDRPGLQRAPAWSSFVSFPSGFTDCEAIFYDEANDRIVFIGQDAGDDLAACYADSGFSHG